MDEKLNIFLNKKILIYGLGRSGLSTFNFLDKKSDVFLYDDSSQDIKKSKIRNKLISYKDIFSLNFDQIILSPGIDINKCRLSKFLKKNYLKIYSDLDVFYSFYKNDCITITGTNGKSTTCKLLYDILINQKFDVRLIGNIGTPVLSIKGVKKKTVFVIEVSSYQLEYSKLFKSKYAVILNITPDHLERHKTINKYVNAKFKLLKNQLEGHIAYVKKDDYLIKKALKFFKTKSKIIKVDTKKDISFSKKINNDYFLNEGNKENLSFIIQISKKLKLKKELLLKTIKEFKGLKYRQQIIFQKKQLTIINDSKSTSFSSSLGILKLNSKIYWLLGGINKKGDKFNLPKKYYHNIKAFIYGKKKNFFNKTLKGKIEYQNFGRLENALKNILKIVKKNKSIKKTILFSPCAASFDSFKNFEDRGFYFNKLVKKYFNEL